MSLILFALVGIPLLLLLTDRLGWTTMYGKKKAGTFLGSAMLGMDQLFAHQEKREAIEYRLEEKRQLRRTDAGEE